MKDAHGHETEIASPAELLERGHKRMLAERDAIIRALVSDDYWIRYGGEWNNFEGDTCEFCNRQVRFNTTGAHCDHAPDCPVGLGYALLGLTP